MFNLVSVHINNDNNNNKTDNFQHAITWHRTITSARAVHKHDISVSVMFVTVSDCT